MFLLKSGHTLQVSIFFLLKTRPFPSFVDDCAHYFLVSFSYVRNNKIMGTARDRTKPLAACVLTVGDMYSSILHFYREQLMRTESNLSEYLIKGSHELFHKCPMVQPLSNSATNESSLIIPAPQEFSLFRPPRKPKSLTGDIFEAIGQEISSIRKSEEEASNVLDSDSVQSDSDSSFLGGRMKVKDEGMSNVIKANERLYGSISLSFFPVPW